MDSEKGLGWLSFSGAMLMIVGILNVLWGISALANSHILVNGTSYQIAHRQSWGWAMLILGVILVLAAFSIWSGGGFGRWIGVIAASLNAMAHVLSVPNTTPWWSLMVFTLDILIIYGLLAYGGKHGPAGSDPRV